MKSLFERLRSRRLASAFVLLATLSAAIVAGSFAAHGVRGQEKQNASADATPLKVVNSTVPPNEFVKIAKRGGPGGGEHQHPDPAQAGSNKGRRNPHGRVQPNPAEARRRRSGRRISSRARTGSGQLPGLLQPLLRRTDARRSRPGRATTARSASRWARASSSIPRATSSPTITWSRRPTRSTSSSRPTPTTRIWAARRG